MFSTVTFPVMRCASCARDVLAAVDVDDAGELVHVCTRCDTALDGSARSMTATSLQMLGYDVEGEVESKGCGSGGSCGSCGTAA